MPKEFSHVLGINLASIWCLKLPVASDLFKRTQVILPILEAFCLLRKSH